MYTLVINTFAIFIITSTVGGIVYELEANHLNEIVNNIKTNVSVTIDKYVQLNEVIAKSTTITQLMRSSDAVNPMHENSLKDSVLTELEAIALDYEGIVANLAILDLNQDGYLTIDGGYSQESFSFKERDYYNAVVEKSTFISSPYTDYLTGELVIGIASPILEVDGTVLGLVLIDLSTEIFNQIIDVSEYKDTGSSLILNHDDNILAYNDFSFIGKNIESLNFEKNQESLLIEFSNPSDDLILYSLGGVEKIGTIAEIEQYGWKILTFIELSEFNTYIHQLLKVLITIQIITILITVLVASITIKFSLQPLSYIRVAMKELAAGNNEYNLEYTANNEIGDLADDVRFASQNVSNYIKKIQHQLDYDDLTSLYTESKFIKETKILMNTNKAEIYSILSIDVDNFKYINDTFGYNNGSEFLKAIGVFFNSAMGENVPIARINADNFVFLLDEEQLGEFKSMHRTFFDAIMIKAKQIIDEHYDLSLSAGIYVVEDITLDVSSMIGCANYAKNKGKSIIGVSVNYYDDKMQEERTAKNYVVSQMRDGARNKEFVVFYQPKVDLVTEKITGAEALVRWNNNGEMIPPNKFIPVFETNGFIETLDYYVIDTTCAFIKENLEKGLPLISINLSGVTIMKSDVVSKVLSIVEKYELNPSQIELEITESAFVSNFDIATEKINIFKSLGFSISMDDFGCGESSLGRLKDIPIDVLKIDRELIVDSYKNDKVDLILKNIVNMAKDLELKTVVEGIETNEQKSLIKQLGCDLGQGYIFYRPLPPKEFLNIL